MRFDLLELDEHELSELNLAISQRRAALESRMKSLREKEGLPEAADVVQRTLTLYLPGDGGPGLSALFTPQKTLDEEAARIARERRNVDANGVNQQDMFGGGTEVGNGVAPGQTEPSTRVFLQPSGETSDTPPEFTGESVEHEPGENADGGLDVEQVAREPETPVDADAEFFGESGPDAGDATDGGAIGDAIVDEPAQVTDESVADAAFDAVQPRVGDDGFSVPDDWTVDRVTLRTTDDDVEPIRASDDAS